MEMNKNSFETVGVYKNVYCIFVWLVSGLSRVGLGDPVLASEWSRVGLGAPV